MITRVELDGFKSFRNFALDLAPFQMIIGANGVGKSNLFDAFALLANLAESDLRTAFQGVRGEPRELFTLFPDGSSLNRMSLAVEMLVEPGVEDSWGARGDVKYTRMRYELEIERRADERGIERLHVIHEMLMPIQRTADLWARRHIGRGREHWLPTLKTGRTVPFISTERDERGGTVYLHQDGRGGDRAAVAHGAERTVLSTILNTEFPHAFAAREEMRGWKVVELNPASIRTTGLLLPHSFIASDGGNLVVALARMKGENPEILTTLTAQLAGLAPSAARVELLERGAHLEPDLRVIMADGRSLPLPLLSDALLRLLALAALRNDPDGGCLFCIEEPENGLDPAAVERIASFLPDIATDLRSAEPDDHPLRQILVATHSPELLRAVVRRLVSMEEGPVHELPELLYAYTAIDADPWEPGELHATRVAHVRPSQQLELNLDDSSDAHACTLAEIEEHLSHTGG